MSDKPESVYELTCSVFGPILGNHSFRRVLAYCFRHRDAGAVFNRNTITATFRGAKAGGNMKQFLRRNFAINLSKKKGFVETAEITLSVERKRDALPG